MSGSSFKIDYRIRPAKSVERKMLAEAFRKLSEFGRLDTYRYIGFGALYFTDFVLFHKALGIKSMVSMEITGDLNKQERFRYNAPYKHVNVHFGPSSITLPKLPWDVRSIVWLDYDGTLNKSALQDIAYVTSKAAAGSLLLVSVNANSDIPEKNEGTGGGMLSRLKAHVGDDKIPAGLESSALSGWGVATTFRDIIDNEIMNALVTVNRGRSNGAKLHYKQLFNFHYSDGARMLTVGGLLYDEGQEALLAKCGFNQLDFFKDGKEPYKIETPLLTYREMHKIDAQIPFEAEDYATIPIPKEEIDKYQAFYRYLPRFVDADSH